MVMIWAFAADSIALNTARDLGGRFAAACFWGSKGAFPAKYTALATRSSLPFNLSDPLANLATQ